MQAVIRRSAILHNLIVVVVVVVVVIVVCDDPIRAARARLLLLDFAAVFVALARGDLVEALQLGLDAREEVGELALGEGVEDGVGGDGLAVAVARDFVGSVFFVFFF